MRNVLFLIGFILMSTPVYASESHNVYQDVYLVTSTKDHSVYGEPITFTVYVGTPNADGTYTPLNSGHITFYDEYAYVDEYGQYDRMAAYFGKVDVVNGMASITVTQFPTTGNLIIGQYWDNGGMLGAGAIEHYYTVTNIPEFPTIAAPIAAILGVLVIVGRKQKRL